MAQQTSDPEVPTRTRRELRAMPRPRASRTTAILVSVATVCLGLLVLESGADVLPDRPLWWVFTWERVAVLVGLLAMLPLLRSWRSLRTPLDLPIGLLVGASLLTTVLTGADFPLWRWLLTGVGTYYLTVLLRRGWASSWSTICTAVVVAATAASVVALRQWNLQSPTGFCRASLDGSSSACSAAGSWIRVVGTFANPNLLVALLVMAVPLALALVRGLQDVGQRALLGLLVVTMCLAGALTFSRTGALALVVGVAATWTLLRPTLVRVSTVLGLAGVLVLAGTVLALVRGIVGVRSEIWTQAVTLTVTHPWGVGLGQAGPAIDARVTYGQTIQHAHNLWLTWGVEVGWLGFAAVLWLAVRSVTVGIRYALDGSTIAPYAVGSLVALGVVSLTDTPTNVVRVALMAWVVLGLVATAGHQAAEQGRHESRD